MRCRKVRKNAFLYFENKLPINEKNKIEEHLKNCALCMDNYNKTEKLIKALRDDKPKMIPENLHKNIMIEVNGLKTFNEEEKRENIIAFKKAIQRAGIVFAAVFIAFFTIQFVDFDYIKENGIEGLLELNEKVTSSINEGKLENTREEDIIYNEMFSGNIQNVTSSKNEALDILDDYASKENDDLKENTLEDKDITESNAKEDNINKNESQKDEINETLLDKGFATMDNYTELLDSYDVVKRSVLRLNVLDFDNVVNQIQDISKKYNSDIYYKNIYYNNDLTDDNEKSNYRTGILALTVLESKYDDLKASIESLGKYDINVDQKDEAQNNPNEFTNLLLEYKNEKITIEEAIQNTENEDEITNLTAELDAVNESIKNIEASIKENADKEGVIKLEITLKECSELDFEGIISNKSFNRALKNSFNNGYVNFVRTMQDICLWTFENILFIIMYVIIFTIVYLVLRTTFLRDRE